MNEIHPSLGGSSEPGAVATRGSMFWIRLLILLGAVALVLPVGLGLLGDIGLANAVSCGGG